jgi:hypothetical protein
VAFWGRDAVAMEGWRGVVVATGFARFGTSAMKLVSNVAEGRLGARAGLTPGAAGVKLCTRDSRILRSQWGRSRRAGRAVEVRGRCIAGVRHGDAGAGCEWRKERTVIRSYQIKITRSHQKSRDRLISELGAHRTARHRSELAGPATNQVFPLSNQNDSWTIPIYLFDSNS